MAVWAIRDGSDTVVTVWVVPGSNRSAVVGEHGEALKVRVAAPREGGKATRAVVRLLADRLGARVELESGATGRMKRLRIRDLGPSEVAERLLE